MTHPAAASLDSTATASRPIAANIVPDTITYEIRVAGHLDDHWAAMLGDFTLVRLDDGSTSLTGPVVDQAQLHGVLARVRDVGVPLLTMRALDHEGTAAMASPEAQPGTAGGRPGR